MYSSSVRRSSFREKEKAARKLDTSFKDVLYAQNSCDEKIDEQTKSNSGTGQHIKSTTVVKIINNKVTANESQSMTTAYGVIKNVYEKPSSKFNDENVQNNVEKNNIAAKDTDDITKKNSSSSSFGNKKAFLDDYNNNQLKLTKVSLDMKALCGCRFLFYSLKSRIHNQITVLKQIIRTASHRIR